MKLKDILNSCGSETNFVKAVEDKLRLLAAENPDFVYNPEGRGHCSYNGRARSDTEITDLSFLGPECKGCIFGQAFQLLGWDDLDELRTRGGINELLHRSCNGISAPYNWRTIQVNQDKGQTWTEAVKVLG